MAAVIETASTPSPCMVAVACSVELCDSHGLTLVPKTLSPVGRRGGSKESSGEGQISPIHPGMAKSRQTQLAAIGLEGKLNVSCRAISAPFDAAGAGLVGRRHAGPVGRAIWVRRLIVPGHAARAGPSALEHHPQTCQGQSRVAAVRRASHPCQAFELVVRVECVGIKGSQQRRRRRAECGQKQGTAGSPLGVSAIRRRGRGHGMTDCLAWRAVKTRKCHAYGGTAASV